MDKLFPHCCIDCKKMEKGNCKHDYSQDLRSYFVNNLIHHAHINVLKRFDFTC